METKKPDGVGAIQPVPVSSPPRKVEARDKVSVDKAEDFAATVTAARHGAAVKRSEHLAGLGAAIREKTYKPDAQSVADELLKSIDLSSKLGKGGRH